MASNCNRCRKQIYAAWRTANGRHYHPHCFTCAICDSDVLSVTNLEASDLKEIYCLGCFDQYFNRIQQVPDDATKCLETDPESCKSMVLKRDNNTADPYCDQSESYITPEASLNAVDQERSPHSHHARSQRRERSERIFQDSIEAVIKDADSYSERQKRSISIPAATVSVKREASNTKLQHAFTSRIPRLKSLTKIPSKPSMQSPQPVARSTSKKHFQNIDIPKRTSIMHLKSPSKKINDYLRLRSPNVATPLKAKHSIASISQTTRSSSSRSLSTVSKSGNLMNISRPSIIESRSIIMPTCQRDFGESKASSISFLKGPTQLSERQKNIESDTANRRRSLPLDEPKLMKMTPYPNVLPSCEQLLSILMKPRNGAKNPLLECKDHFLLQLKTEEYDEREPAKKIGSNPLDCPICCEALIITDDSREQSFENSVTSCGHIFHRKCINNWLLNPGNSRCPICCKLCLKESIIPVYLEANAKAEQSLKPNEPSLGTLRMNFKELSEKYEALLKEHSQCSVKSLVADSLRNAYEMECRNRVELQWENKRLQRKIEELVDINASPQGDSPLGTI